VLAGDLVGNDGTNKAIEPGFTLGERLKLSKNKRMGLLLLPLIREL
jgi:hypothetical protein